MCQNPVAHLGAAYPCLLYTSPKWEGLPGDQRPEKGLLRLRAGMGLYANNRPAKIWPQLADASPLKKSIVDQGIDFIVVRELIGGVYFGEHKTIAVSYTHLR